MGNHHHDGNGSSIVILEQGSTTAPMRFRMITKKGVSPPAAECHPSQSEDFHVLRGVLDLGMVNGTHVRLKAGDRFHLPAGTPHLPANGCDGADEECEFEATLTPGLETADMFVDLFEAFREHKGFGQFVRVATVMRRYKTNITFNAPMNALLATVAGLFGSKKKEAKALDAAA